MSIYTAEVTLSPVGNSNIDGIAAGGTGLIWDKSIDNPPVRSVSVAPSGTPFALGEGTEVEGKRARFVVTLARFTTDYAPEFQLTMTLFRDGDEVETWPEQPKDRQFPSGKLQTTFIFIFDVEEANS